MASNDEDLCTSHADFAVLCSFIDKFGDKLGLTLPNIGELQSSLEDTDTVSPIVSQSVSQLLRRINKAVKLDRWERGLQRFAHNYSHQDGWELERFGFKKAKLEVKIRVIKNLLEAQFDMYKSFKDKVNLLSANELRLQPCGRDKKGVSYWCQLDDCANMRIYSDDQDEETWTLVASTREELVALIAELESESPPGASREMSVDGSRSGTATPMGLSEAPTPVDSKAPTPVPSGRTSPVLDTGQDQERNHRTEESEQTPEKDEEMKEKVNGGNVTKIVKEEEYKVKYSKDSMITLTIKQKVKEKPSDIAEEKADVKKSKSENIKDNPVIMGHNIQVSKVEPQDKAEMINRVEINDGKNDENIVKGEKDSGASQSNVCNIKKESEKTDTETEKPAKMINESKLKVAVVEKKEKEKVCERESEEVVDGKVTDVTVERDKVTPPTVEVKVSEQKVYREKKQTVDAKVSEIKIGDKGENEREKEAKKDEKREGERETKTEKREKPKVKKHQENEPVISDTESKQDVKHNAAEKSATVRKEEENKPSSKADHRSREQVEKEQKQASKLEIKLSVKLEAHQKDIAKAEEKTCGKEEPSNKEEEKKLEKECLSKKMDEMNVAREPLIDKKIEKESLPSKKLDPGGSKKGEEEQILSKKTEQRVENDPLPKKITEEKKSEKESLACKKTEEKAKRVEKESALSKKVEKEQVPSKKVGQDREQLAFKKVEENKEELPVPSKKTEPLPDKKKEEKSMEKQALVSKKVENQDKEKQPLSSKKAEEKEKKPSLKGEIKPPLSSNPGDSADEKVVGVKSPENKVLDEKNCKEQLPMKKEEEQKSSIAEKGYIPGKLHKSGPEKTALSTNIGGKSLKSRASEEARKGADVNKEDDIKDSTTKKEGKSGEKTKEAIVETCKVLEGKSVTKDILGISKVEIESQKEKAKVENASQKDKAKIESESQEDKAKVESESKKDKAKVESESQKDKLKVESESKKDKAKFESESQKDKAKVESESKEDKVESESQKAKAKIESESQKDNAKVESESKKNKAKVESQSQKDKAKVESESKKDKAKVESESKKDKVNVESESKKDKAKVESESQKDKVKVESESQKDKLKVESESQKDKAKVESESQKDKLKVESESKKDKAKVEIESQKDKAKVESESKKDKATVESESQKDKAKVESESQKDKAKVESESKKDQAKVESESTKEKTKPKSESSKEKMKVGSESQKEKSKVESDSQKEKPVCEAKGPATKIEKKDGAGTTNLDTSKPQAAVGKKVSGTPGPKAVDDDTKAICLDIAAKKERVKSGIPERIEPKKKESVWDKLNKMKEKVEVKHDEGGHKKAGDVQKDSTGSSKETSATKFGPEVTKLNLQPGLSTAKERRDPELESEPPEKKICLQKDKPEITPQISKQNVVEQGKPCATTSLFQRAWEDKPSDKPKPKIPFPPQQPSMEGPEQLLLPIPPQQTPKEGPKLMSIESLVGPSSKSSSSSSESHPPIITSAAGNRALALKGEDNVEPPLKKLKVTDHKALESQKESPRSEHQAHRGLLPIPPESHKYGEREKTGGPVKTPSKPEESVSSIKGKDAKSEQATVRKEEKAVIHKEQHALSSTTPSKDQTPKADHKGSGHSTADKNVDHSKPITLSAVQPEDKGIGARVDDPARSKPAENKKGSFVKERDKELARVEKTDDPTNKVSESGKSNLAPKEEHKTAVEMKKEADASRAAENADKLEGKTSQAEITKTASQSIERKEESVELIKPSKTDVDIKQTEEIKPVKATPVVGEAIEEPVMVVKGDGEGAPCQAGNPFFTKDGNYLSSAKPWWECFSEGTNSLVGEAVEEEVMYFSGDGNGADCDAGNNGDETETKAEAKQGEGGGSSDTAVTSSSQRNATAGDCKSQKEVKGLDGSCESDEAKVNGLRTLESVDGKSEGHDGKHSSVNSKKLNENNVLNEHNSKESEDENDHKVKDKCKQSNDKDKDNFEDTETANDNTSSLRKTLRSGRGVHEEKAEKPEDSAEEPQSASEKRKNKKKKGKRSPSQKKIRSKDRKEKSEAESEEEEEDESEKDEESEPDSRRRRSSGHHKRGRGRPQKRRRSHRNKSDKDDDDDDDDDDDAGEDNMEDDDTAPPPIRKRRQRGKGSSARPLPDVPRQKSVRIAKIREKEEVERRELEAMRMKQLAEENRLRELKVKARQERRSQRELKKGRREKKEKKDKEKRKRKRKKRVKKRKTSNDPWAHSSTSSSSSSEEEEDLEEDEEEEKLVFKSDHEFSPESDIEEGDAQPIKRARTAKKVTTESEAEDECDGAEDEDEEDQTQCTKCGHDDHPETILLCDTCDAGWHLSCLRPPLLSVPEGDWICPTCEHVQLIKKLRDLLHEFDECQKRAQNEEQRRQRLAFVNVSMSNVLSGPDGKKKKKRHREDGEDLDDDDDDSGSDSDSDDSDSESDDSSESSSQSSDSTAPLYTFRARTNRTLKEQVENFDEMINEAIRDEMEAAAGAGNAGRGKDIENIMQANEEEIEVKEEEKIEEEKVEKAEVEEEEEEEENKNKNEEEKIEKNNISKEDEVDGKREREDDENQEDEDEDDVAPKRKKVKKPPKKGSDDKDNCKESDESDSEDEVRVGRRRVGKLSICLSVKKKRRLTDLDAEDDDDPSDEDFMNSSEEEEEETEESLDSSSSISTEMDSDDSDVVGGSRRRGRLESLPPLRRSARNRKDKQTYEDSDEEERVIKRQKNKKKKKRRRSSSEDESSDSDKSFGRRRKASRKRKLLSSRSKGRKSRKGKIKKKQTKSKPKKEPGEEGEVKPSKPKIKYAKPPKVKTEGEEEKAERRVTRGRQVNYCDDFMLSDDTDTEEPQKKWRGKVMKGERVPTESSEYEASDDEMMKRRGVSGGLGRGKVMKGEEEDEENKSVQKKKKRGRPRKEDELIGKPSPPRSAAVQTTDSVLSPTLPLVPSLPVISSTSAITITPATSVRTMPTANASTIIGPSLPPVSITPVIKASVPATITSTPLVAATAAANSPSHNTPKSKVATPPTTLASAITNKPMPVNVSSSVNMGSSSPVHQPLGKWSPHLSGVGSTPNTPPRPSVVAGAGHGAGTPPRPGLSGPSVTASPPPPYRSSPLPMTPSGSILPPISSASNIPPVGPPATSSAHSTPYPPYRTQPEHFSSHPAFPSYSSPGPGRHSPSPHSAPPRHPTHLPPGHPLARLPPNYGPPLGSVPGASQGPYTPRGMTSHPGVLRGPHDLYRASPSSLPGHGSPSHPGHPHLIMKPGYPGLEPLPYAGSPSSTPLGLLQGTQGSPAHQSPGDDSKEDALLTGKGPGEFSSGLMSYFSSQRDDDIE